MHDELLFVYGTLRSGAGHHMFESLQAAASLLDRAVFQGRLYRVADYPGAVASTDPNDRVQGETYRVHEPETLLPRLDAYEGCDPRDPRAPYLRRKLPVTLRSGEQVVAWIYLYNGPTDALERIRSGDFLERR